ncbi:surfeit locus protein 2-like [Gigantopelta aegis]|uniref:surfeit locus protein 2-like n=1 Tax=Gigantopelta aegis TaxID=1735272 RepID=UPI001B88A8C7|nr:surfeit locus protein 2-like [Gigantopelta aegis]
MAATVAGHVKCPPKDVQKLLTRYPVLVFQEETNKVKCSLSGHQMPCKADAILSYVSGKKFLKLYKDKEFGYEKYEPHVVPSKKRRQEHLLFCKLTLRHINKTPRDVERHVSGKKYKRALERWRKCQETGEKFKPLGHRKKLEPRDESDKVPEFLNSDEEKQSDSDLSDLYPAEDFESPGDEEIEIDSDSDDQDSVTNVANGGGLLKDVESSEDENLKVETKGHSKSKKAKPSRKIMKERPNKNKKKPRLL